MSRAALAACALCALVANDTLSQSPSAAAGAPYPVRPVRVLVATSPGSAADIVARVIVQRLPETFGQQLVVDNRAGAGGNLGAEIAARAAPDGYTLFVASPAHVINASLQAKPAYDLGRDFAPVSLLTTGAYVLVVNPRVQAKTVKELVALAKAQPGKLNYASAGSGNATHLAGELFRILAAVNIVHVPYKGSSPAVIDLLGGQVDLMFANLAAAMPEIQSGKLRALAVTGAKRSAAAPQLQTVAEAGVPGYEVTSWFGVLAPAATRPEIVARINSDFVRTVNAPEVKERLATQGAEVVGSTPQEFAAHIRAEAARWSKVIKAAGIRAD